MSKSKIILNEHAVQAAVKGEDSNWIKSKRYWFLTSFILPAIPLISAFLAVTTESGMWLWSGVVVMYGVLPLIDYLSGLDAANPDEELIEELSTSRYYVYIMYAATFAHWTALVGMAYVVASYDWSWFSILGAGLTAGIINGLGLVAGHEMGHKLNDKGQVISAKLILACSGYGHFFIEHNKGHHKDVATPEDPATSRFGESIYKFVRREIPGAFNRAWGLEKTRLHRLGKSQWSLSNEIIPPALLTIAAYGTMIALWGAVMIPFLALASAYGWWQLTCANYVEHYGLLRLKSENGRYERCQPKHSWNSNHKVSNLVLLHLQRHSDHHAHPTRPYQVLRDYPEVPCLPSGYPWMFAVAMVPAAWFSIMNPKVVAWANGDMRNVNIDPDVKAKVMAKYHDPKDIVKAA